MPSDQALQDATLNYVKGINHKLAANEEYYAGLYNAVGSACTSSTQVFGGYKFEKINRKEGKDKDEHYIGFAPNVNE
jgi:hypothetical protein